MNVGTNYTLLLISRRSINIFLYLNKNRTMKKMILLVVLIAAFAFNGNTKAKIPVCIPCEYIETVMDLPDTIQFIGEDNVALNIGYRYEQFNIVWIPLWNKEGEYCLVNNAEDVYYELSNEEKAYLTEKFNAEFEGNPLSMWDKIGGKIILLIILVFVIIGYLPSKKEKAE